MKKSFFLALATVLSLATPAMSQTSNTTNDSKTEEVAISSAVAKSDAVAAPTDEEIKKMSIFEACKAIGVDPSYDARYDDIILPLCRAGVVMFDASTNPYGGSADPQAACYYYVGTGAQNKILVRNLLANRHLLKKGKLVPGAATRWKLVK